MRSIMGRKRYRFRGEGGIKILFVGWGVQVCIILLGGWYGQNFLGQSKRGTHC
jgi:hypothetical protein